MGCRFLRSSTHPARAVGRAGQALFARRYLAAAQPLAPWWLAVAARHRLGDTTVRESEAAMLRRLLGSRRLADCGPG
jgi:hypothetical protein